MMADKDKLAKDIKIAGSQEFLKSSQSHISKHAFVIDIR